MERDHRCGRLDERHAAGLTAEQHSAMDRLVIDPCWALASYSEPAS
jgi:hypothetical protein